MQRLSKQLFDFFVSAIFVLCTFPIYLIISLVIIISDFESPFFIQERIGYKEKVFLLLKFRTMKKSKPSSNGSFDVGDSSRVTSIGKVLRKTKLDEFPQLINVLKGDMSIVGPRPEVKHWTTVYPEKWKIVHSVRPGITDNASIVFRNEEEILAQSEDPEKTYRDVILPRKLDLYIDYVNNQSFWGDIKIIFRTLKAVIIK